MPDRLRVVLDTNVFVSAVLFNGIANRLVDLWQKGDILFLMSQEILNEYIKVLSYTKFRLTDGEIKYILQEELLPFVKPLVVKQQVDAIKADPSDNRFLSLALQGKADYIISGDKHLLELGKYRTTRIVSLNSFLSLLSEKRI